tara:strand:+ start:37926 stop:38165 length:240 start_codon:yes stop_codon:yes gene_type:complete
LSVKAFILITTKVGKSREVLSRLNEIDSIEAVDSVLGPYDIIAVARGEDVNSIGDLVPSMIHPIDGVDRTTTCLSVKKE